jgi:hypothetical protein
MTGSSDQSSINYKVFIYIKFRGGHFILLNMVISLTLERWEIPRPDTQGTARGPSGPPIKFQGVLLANPCVLMLQAVKHNDVIDSRDVGGVLEVRGSGVRAALSVYIDGAFPTSLESTIL